MPAGSSGPEGSTALGREGSAGRPSPSGALSGPAMVGLLSNGRATCEAPHTHPTPPHPSPAMPLGRGGEGTTVAGAALLLGLCVGRGVRSRVSAPRPLLGQGRGGETPYPRPWAGSRSPAALTQGLGSGG